MSRKTIFDLPSNTRQQDDKQQRCKERTQTLKLATFGRHNRSARAAQPPIRDDHHRIIQEHGASHTANGAYTSTSQLPTAKAACASFAGAVVLGLLLTCGVLGGMATAANAAWGPCHARSAPNEHCYSLAHGNPLDLEDAFLDGIAVSEIDVTGCLTLGTGGWPRFITNEMWVSNERVSHEWLESGLITGYETESCTQLHRFWAYREATSEIVLHTQKSATVSLNYSHPVMIKIESPGEWSIWWSPEAGVWDRELTHNMEFLYSNKAEIGMEAATEVAPTDRSWQFPERYYSSTPWELWPSGTYLEWEEGYTCAESVSADPGNVEVGTPYC